MNLLPCYFCSLQGIFLSLATIIYYCRHTNSSSEPLLHAVVSFRVFQSYMRFLMMVPICMALRLSCLYYSNETYYAASFLVVLTDKLFSRLWRVHYCLSSLYLLQTMCSHLSFVSCSLIFQLCCSWCLYNCYCPCFGGVLLLILKNFWVVHNIT